MTTSDARAGRGRLSIVAAALVVARRDFVAILFSRSFVFFLIGPLFPLLVAVMASGVGQRVQENTAQATLGVAMAPRDGQAMLAAARKLNPQLGATLPDLVVIAEPDPDEQFDPADALRDRQANLSAVLSGTPAHPVLTGPAGQIQAWQGPVALIAAEALGHGPQVFPPVALAATAVNSADARVGRMRTAQAGQTLLFLLTMLLAGMVLSNLVEEKANKIIEILAAAIPMDAVFLGKLVAMLAISFVGIAVWGLTIGGAALAGGRSLGELATPAVGWPLFIALGVAYFTMAYLLLGSIFLTIGSMAATVREVQTLSMPVTMVQLLVYFFASYALAAPHSLVEQLAVAFPFSSPFAMLARAAQEGNVVQHLLALAWQAFWVSLSVRLGARLFRRRVMQSGPAKVRSRKAKPKAA